MWLRIYHLMGTYSHRLLAVKESVLWRDWAPRGSEWNTELVHVVQCGHWRRLS